MRLFDHSESPFSWERSPGGNGAAVERTRPIGGSLPLVSADETCETSGPPVRRFPIGAEPVEGGVSFRVWSPLRESVTAILETGSRTVRFPLTPEPDGYFSGITTRCDTGTLYRFAVSDGEKLYPDPASRSQPDGPHGPSQVVDPSVFPWTDTTWSGVRSAGQVLYEMHVGTFTRQGTWQAAETKLPHLAELGVTIIEMMPIAEFSGAFGWGYDGVNLFAPTRLYGTPDDFRHFVDRAHQLGIGVILDVVYNHFGPDGNYLPAFSRDYLTDRYKNDWGQAINYDGANSIPVREFVVANAAYWIDEFHLDGLRLDATQDIHDASSDHVLAAITRAARAAAGKRSIFIVAENEPQHVRHVLPSDQGGFNMNALWNDDLHHSAMVALSGHSEAYYTDYQGRPQEFISAFKRGYLYQGQQYTWQKRRRGTPAWRANPSNFVTFLQNHDQIANSGGGLRCHQLASAGVYRAMTGLFLLAPGTPMLFQGQEFAASSPFYYFASHQPELARMVADGRKAFLAQFPSLATDEMQARDPNPAAPETLERSRLDWSECESHAGILEMHRDLLRLRKNDPVLSKIVSQATRDFDGAVLGPEAFLLRFFDESGSDRLLVVNFGHDLPLTPGPEPLLAEPEGHAWEIAWSSEDPRYGGLGIVPHAQGGNWFLPGRTTTFFVSTDIGLFGDLCRSSEESDRNGHGDAAAEKPRTTEKRRAL